MNQKLWEVQLKDMDAELLNSLASVLKDTFKENGVTVQVDAYKVPVGAVLMMNTHYKETEKLTVKKHLMVVVNKITATDLRELIKDIKSTAEFELLQTRIDDWIFNNDRLYSNQCVLTELCETEDEEITLSVNERQWIARLARVAGSYLLELGEVGDATYLLDATYDIEWSPKLKMDPRLAELLLLGNDQLDNHLMRLSEESSSDLTEYNKVLLLTEQPTMANKFRDLLRVYVKGEV